MSYHNLLARRLPVSPLFLLRNEPSEAAEPKLHPNLLPHPDPATWAAASLAFQPDPIQSEILSHPAHRLMLLCSRQFGKTQITAIKALHFALSYPESLVVVASPTERRSAEWLLRVTSLLQSLSIPHRRDGIHHYSALLPNRSRLIGLPGAANNNRGYPAHLLIFEEAAWVPDLLWHALAPSLAVTRGRLWLISSAGPQLGFFFRQWSEPDHPAAPLRWARFRVTAEQCPRISPEALAEQRLLHGESIFRREFLCEFSSDGPAAIPPELLHRAFDPALPSLNKGRALWRENL